jgi:hypothetical protein
MIGDASYLSIVNSEVSAIVTRSILAGQTLIERPLLETASTSRVPREPVFTLWPLSFLQILLLD